MATEPQSTSHSTSLVNASMKPVCGLNTYGTPQHGREGGKSKQASNKVTQAKARGNAPANLPVDPPNISGETAALTWF